MKSEYEREQDELDDIRRRLHNARDIDLDEAQELWYRKNYIEAGRAFGEQTEDYHDDR